MEEVKKLDEINNYLSVIHKAEGMIEDLLINTLKEEITMKEYNYQLNGYLAGIGAFYQSIIELSENMHMEDLVRKYSNELKIIDKNHKKFVKDPFLYLQIQKEVLRRKGLLDK